MCLSLCLAAAVPIETHAASPAASLAAASPLASSVAASPAASPSPIPPASPPLAVAAALGSWTQVPAPSWRHPLGRLVRLADGRVLAFGGGSTVFIGDPNHPNRQFLATDLFDPATGRWKKGAWQPALAFDPPAVALPDDRVLVLDMALRGAKGSVRLYDAKRDRWTTGRTMHTPRNLAAVGLLPNGKVLAAGGYSSNGHPSNAVEVYDPAHDTWSRAPKLHTARSAASAISLADGRVLVVGGIGQMHGSKPAKGIATAEIFDPTTSHWTTLDPFDAQIAASMTRQPDLIALTDGRVAALGTSDTWSVPLQLFDPATNAWTSLPQTLVPRIAATVAALPDGSLLLSGGRVPDGPGDCFAVSGSERYDPVTGSWVTDAPMRSARFLAQSVSLEDGSVLVMGGQHPIVPGECAAQDGFAGTDAGGGSEIYALPR